MNVQSSPCIVERRLLACFKAHKLSGVSVLVAFSGGSDSTALLCAAAAVASARELKVFAAWVDHGIRPSDERGEERRFVESLTTRLGVPCDVTEAPEDPLSDRARRKGESLEAEARAFRYENLMRAAARFGCVRILTAHTKDDQTETLLLRVLSGSGAAGLRGIPADRPPFLRPFLSVSKAELLKYLKSFDQDWRDDSTNAHGDYRRNRIRREILPRLEEAVPGFRSALFALGEKSRMDEDLLMKLSRKALPVSRLEDESAIPAAAFWRAHPALRLRILTTEAGRLLGEGRRVPYALVRAAAIARRPAGKEAPSHPERYLAEGAGLKFVSDGAVVRIVRLRDPAEPGLSGYAPKRGAEDVTPGGGYAFLFESAGIRRIDTGGSCRIYFGEDARGPVLGTFDFPVLVRSRRPGDRIEIRGGSKSVDDLLPELLVRPETKGFVPVLEDRRGIFAVLGSSLGGKDRYRHFPAALDLSQPRLSVELKGFGPFDR